MNERIANIINKFVKYKITLDELEETAPLISTEDFKSQYLFIEDIQAVFQEEGKVDLKKKLEQIIIEEKEREATKSRIVKLKEYKMHAIAACILMVCSIAVFRSTTGYNDVKHFRKSYIENHG